jgi:hypothetical protein
MYLLKDDYHYGGTVSKQWHMEGGNCNAMQQACYTTMMLDGQDNNKKPKRKENKHINKKYIKTIVFL